VPAKVIAAIAADTHLAPTAFAGSGVRGDAVCSVHQIADYCIDHRVKKLFLLGDINDRVLVRSYVTTFWTKLMRRLAARARVGYLQGNHDYDDPPFLDGYVAALHIHEREFDVGPFKGYAFDYQPTENLPAALDRIPKGSDILFCHQAWKEWLGFEGSYQGSFEDVPIVETLFSGDNHDNLTGTYTGKSGQVLECFSPGSVCLQTTGEVEDKYFFILREDGEVGRVKLKTRRLIVSEPIKNDTHLEEFLKTLPQEIERVRDLAASDNLPEHLHAPVVRVIYRRCMNHVVGRVTRLVKGLAHLFWCERLIDEEDSPTASVVRVKGAAITPRSILPGMSDDPRVLGLLDRVLAANDPKAEFARWQSEFPESEE
jgi:hypothetical protein